MQIAVHIGALRGWRRALVAVLAGALSALACAPFHGFPVLFLTFPVLVWLLDGACFPETGQTETATLWRRLRWAMGLGWLFGFGYFFAGLYWVGEAFLVEAEIFGWLLPFAISGLPAGLALFFALATALACVLWKPGPARLVGLALSFTLTEWLRGHLFTGFPWNSLGLAVTGNDSLLQTASLFGMYGLTLPSVMIFAAPAVLAHGARGRASMSVMGYTRLAWGYVAVMAVMLVLGWGWGQYRLSGAVVAVVDDVRLRIVQPNVAQREKWVPSNRQGIFERHLALGWDKKATHRSAKTQVAPATHIIWPEVAVPFLIGSSTVARKMLAEVMSKGQILITGAIRAENADPGTPPEEREIFNSILVMNDEAQVIHRYDKKHLVPFGEYLPFRGLLEAIGLRQLTKLRGAFNTGQGPRRLKPKNGPMFAPLVCYEIIFSGDVVSPGQRPSWLLNVTNDAWFGKTTGPLQHFHQARVRAVEEGLPVVRAANTGVSAIIDGYGRVRESLGLGEQGIVEGRLPVPLPETLFHRHGGIVLLLLLLICAALWLLLVRMIRTSL